MTTAFIIIEFSIIVIYDLVMLWKNRKKEDSKWKFITTIFRHWYKDAPYVPYMVGVVFIGHFQTEIEVYGVPFFIGFSSIYIGWTILMSITKIKFLRKFYNINRICFVPLALGAVVGAFWRG
jgi:hypothetical protein